MKIVGWCIGVLLALISCSLYHRDIKKIRETGQIVYEQRDVLYNANQELRVIDLLLTTPSSTTLGGAGSVQTGSNVSRIITKSETVEIAQNVIAADTIWRQVHANKTSVYLHVLLTTTNNGNTESDSQGEKEQDKERADIVVTSKRFAAGLALHGVVGLIKYDKIPKSFKYRYLLSDFGLVDVTPQEGLLTGHNSFILFCFIQDMHLRRYFLLCCSEFSNLHVCIYMQLNELTPQAAR